MTMLATTQRLSRLLEERERVLEAFIGAEQEQIALACHAMARAFARGATLIPFGAGPAATDAAHVAVEFMHPVIVGKRALPAIAPPNDPTGASSLARLARPDDIALAIAHSGTQPEVDRFLEEARHGGLLTIALLGAGGSSKADHRLVVPCEDEQIVQEVQETVYHVLWELVHVFFEHPALLDEACITCGDVAVAARVVAVRTGTALIEKDGAREEVAVELVPGVEVGDTVLCHAGIALEKVVDATVGAPAPPDPTGFLYPFLSSEEKSLGAVLEDVKSSTVQKAADVVALRRAIDLEAVQGCGADLRARLRSGGRLIAFGNGGSSTDAQDLVSDCLTRELPAIALTNDAATVTAVANDVGFDRVFARQLIALARPLDVAVAISTSGSSPNIVAGLEEAHRRGMLTVAITGYDGGRLAQLEWLDHLLIARSDYIPRLQEAHATIYHLMVAVAGDAG